MEPSLVPPPASPAPLHNIRKTLMIGAAAVIILCLVISAWLLLSNKKIGDASGTLGCVYVPETVSASDFVHAEKVPAARTLPASMPTYSYTDPLVAAGISIKLPYNEKPVINKFDPYTFASTSSKRIGVVKYANIGDLKGTLTDVPCPQVKTDFDAWYAGKTDLQIAQSLMNLTSATQGTLSRDLFLSLLAAKELFQGKKDAQIITIGSYSVLVFGPEKGTGRIDVYSTDGTESVTIIYNGLTSADVDYLLNSIKPAS